LAPAENSYTSKLFEDPKLLKEKLLEEAAELADAETQSEVVWETADLLYFALTAMSSHEVPFSAVMRELDRRAGIPAAI